MVNLTINGKAVAARDGQTILQAARDAGVDIPTLCYLEGINEIGACRVCVVEIEGMDRLVSACDAPAEDGISVLTNSPRVRRARKTNVALLLSRHDCHCVTCLRSGSCQLQDLANSLGIHTQPYAAEIPACEWDATLPLKRDAGKCVQCMRCVQVCDKVQDLHIWDVSNAGGRIDVNTRGGQPLDKTDCALCGQCITHCPTGALTARDDTDAVLDALADPELTTVVQVAPAVRAAWAETLGLTREEATPGKMAAALRRIGFDYVFDTDFAADVTIMEEGTEFIGRALYAEKPSKYPMFTSCCPGWVRFMKSQYPDMVDCLSSAKSPQQIFGALAKSYFAEQKNIDPKKLFVVSVMPCVAKKHECALETMNAAGAGQDVDVALTTREFARLLRADRINIAALPEESFDSPMGESTGAGVIFGATGGVMEAALRTVYCVVTGGKPPITDAFTSVRGLEAYEDGWQSAEFDVSGKTLRVAVASGLGNTRRLIEAIRRGDVHYDFVEIMACPGGCAGGGGQPVARNQELAVARGARLYDIDTAMPIRYSHENPAVQALYKNYLEKPVSHRAHELLHSDHGDWKMPHK